MPSNWRHPRDINLPCTALFVLVLKAFDRLNSWHSELRSASYNSGSEAEAVFSVSFHSICCMASLKLIWKVLLLLLITMGVSKGRYPKASKKQLSSPETNIWWSHRCAQLLSTKWSSGARPSLEGHGIVMLVGPVQFHAMFKGRKLTSPVHMRQDLETSGCLWLKFSENSLFRNLWWRFWTQE